MPKAQYTPIMTVADLEAFIENDFPQVHMDGRVFHIIDVGPGTTTMRLEPTERHLRPGGTVSGPTLFTIADVCAYMVILAHIGPAKHTVTTSLNINFMHKAAPGLIDCTCRLLKLGKRLAVIEADITDSDGTLIAHATATYSIPPGDRDTVK